MTDAPRDISGKKKDQSEERRQFSAVTIVIVEVVWLLGGIRLYRNGFFSPEFIIWSVITIASIFLYIYSIGKK